MKPKFFPTHTTPTSSPSLPMTVVTEQHTEEAERFVPIEGTEWSVRDAAWRSSTQLEILAWELADAGIRRLRVG
jgi:hypothetical protein